MTLKYAYNQLGQRILDDRSMPNGNRLARFSYNQRLELVKSVRDRGGCGPDEVHTYAYDLNHNWTKKDGVSYTNNIADQLLAVAGGGSLNYNDSGQATDVQGWDVSYNFADQITGIIAPGKNIAYRYDGAGQRVEKTVNGVTQQFLWNGGDICKEYRADGTVRADYFLGAGREGVKTNGQWYYYLSDIQGSTLMLTDASGYSAATYEYSDYGETRQTSGSTAMYNPFLYTGQEYDFETSLYHLRARHYSPTNGRFFSRDPIGGSNMYAYCVGDPINFADPSGLAATWVGTGPGLPLVNRSVTSDPSAIVPHNVSLSEFKSAYEQTTGMLMLFIHNQHTKQKGAIFSDQDFRFQNAQDWVRNSQLKVFIVVACSSALDFPDSWKNPAAGQVTIGLKKTTPILTMHRFIPGIIKAFESGLGAQAAVDSAVQSTGIAKSFMSGNVAIFPQGSNVRL